MIMSQSKKSKRSPNFSLVEVEVLVGEIDMHKHIIFAKQNNIITNSKKKIVWESIKENVNSVDNNTRTAEDVKKKWQMLASSVKAKWNLIRLESNKTGGGPSVATPLTPIEERIAAIMGRTALGGIDDGLDTTESSASAKETKCAAATITIPDLDNSTNGAVDVFYVNTPYDVAGTTTQILDPQIVEPILENVNESQKSVDDVAKPPEISSEERLIAIEEKRLEVETERLQVEKERLAVEKERLSVEKEHLEINRQKFNVYISSLAGVQPVVEMIPSVNGC